jgi:5'-3' exonuclease
MTIAEKPGRVVLIDSYGLIYRAFFALPMLTTKTGQPINAAYGFTTMLGRIIADEKPDYLIAAFDKGPPQARIDRFPAYKAHFSGSRYTHCRNGGRGSRRCDRHIGAQG